VLRIKRVGYGRFRASVAAQDRGSEQYGHIFEDPGEATVRGGGHPSFGYPTMIRTTLCSSCGENSKESTLKKECYLVLRNFAITATVLMFSSSTVGANEPEREMEAFIQSALHELTLPTSIEKPTRAALLKYYRAFADKNLKVRQEYSTYEKSEVLDFGTLRNAADIHRWLPIIQRYLDAAQDCLAHFDSGEKLIAEYLGQEHVPVKEIEAFVAGFKRSSGQRMDARKLPAVHVQVATNTRNFIEFLIANKAVWAIDPESHSPTSNDGAFIKQYDSWIEKLGADEALFNSYVEKYG
jgi:hypothetical protein